MTPRLLSLFVLLFFASRSSADVFDEIGLTKPAPQQARKFGPAVIAAKDRVVFPQAVREMAEAMDAHKGQLRFAFRDVRYCLANGVDPCYISQEFNPAFWRSSRPSMGTFKVKDGVSPSAAVAGVLTHPGQYQIECATAIKLTLSLAILRTIGPDRFDKAAAGLEIGSGPYESVLAALMQRQSDSGKPADKFPGVAAADFAAKMRPGDGAYMINLRPKEGMRDGGWRGENALYVGDGRFYGHPLGLVGAKDIVDKLTTAWDDVPGPVPGYGVPNQAPWFVDEVYRPNVDAVAALGL